MRDEGRDCFTPHMCSGFPPSPRLRRTGAMTSVGAEAPKTKCPRWAKRPRFDDCEWRPLFRHCERSEAISARSAVLCVMCNVKDFKLSDLRL